MRPEFLSEEEFLTECEERCDAEGWGGFTYNRTGSLKNTAYFHTQGATFEPRLTLDP